MKSVRFTTLLHPPSERLEICKDGTTYLVDVPSGQSYAQIGNDFFPVGGCPFPADLWRARLWRLAHKHIHLIALALLTTALLVVMQFWLMVFMPADFAATFISRFSMFVNLALVFVLIAAFVAYVAGKFFPAFTIKVGEDKQPMLLDAGQLDVSPHIFVASVSEAETAEEFAKRIGEAYSDAHKTGSWVIVLPFRAHRFAVERSPGEPESNCSAFLRSAAFSDAGFAEPEILEAQRKYGKETFAQYLAYCRGVAADFRLWAESQRAMSTNPIHEMLANMKKTAATICLALFCCAGLLAQSKTNRLIGFMGYRAETVAPAQGKEVAFVFERNQITVTADGRKTLVELLKGSPYFTDKDNAGELAAVYIGGERQAKSETAAPIARRRAAATAEKQEPDAPPVSAIPVPTLGALDKQDGFFANFATGLPDSMEFERMKAIERLGFDKFASRVIPALNYLIFFYEEFVVMLLLGIAGLLWAMAKYSASDSVKNFYGVLLVGYFLTRMHLWSKAWFAGILWAIAIPYSLHFILMMYLGERPSMGNVVIIAVCAYLLFVLYEKITPDTPGSKRDTDGNYQSPFDRRQLNG